MNSRVEPEEMLRICLRIVRDPRTDTNTILPSGLISSKFSFYHIRRIARFGRHKHIPKAKTLESQDSLNVVR
jgi:hypothetical protein